MMGRGTRWLAVALGGALVVAGGRPAQADEPARTRRSDDSGRYPAAKARFDAAQALFDEGRFDDAYSQFLAAYVLTGSPNAHFMMARCLSARGNAPDAHRAMAATLQEAAELAETEPRYTSTRDAAAAELALLDRRVGKLVIAPLEPAPRGAVITINGRRLSASEIGVPIAVEPGESVVELRRGAQRLVHRLIVVMAGETKAVALVQTAAVSADPSPALLAAGGGPSAAGERAARPAPTGLYSAQMSGFALGGLGLAGMVVFGAAGAAADTKFAELQRACGSARCVEPLYGPVVDAGKTLDAAANAGLVVGLVGLVSGGTLVTVGALRGARPATVSASVSNDGVRFVVKGAF